MPYLPDLTEGAQTRQSVEVFGGYNHNLRIGEGEWYHETNLTSAHYPLFSQRSARSTYIPGLRNPRGVLAKDALAYVDGATLYYNGYPVDGIHLSGDGPVQLVSMGAYLCVFPHGVYVNTADLSDCGSMAADYQSVENANVTYALSRQDGTPYEGVAVSPSEPGEPENGMQWIDTSAQPHVLKQYSASTGAWVEIPTVYVRIEATGIGQQFNPYDGVFISGATCGDEDVREQVEALNATAIIQSKSDNHIVVTGMLDKLCVQNTGHIRVERRVPKMDYVCEANNRLWGCYYGALNGETLNEIYACKLGDFRNWNCFMGISTDSYVVSVGTDGEFTGCISHLGYPLFFKENYIHKLYGAQPASFQLQTTACRGVQRGSAGSLAVVNEVLYYKSRRDICAYDGSLPVGVSDPLGPELYQSACAGTVNGRYYISMQGADGKWTLFVYDTVRGIWHREDATHASGFAAWGDALYYIDPDRGAIMDVSGAKGTREGAISWSAESGLIGYELVDHKYISRFNFRMRLGEGARCRLWIDYDSSGQWEDQGEVTGAGVGSFVLPVIPRRCDHFRVKLTGEGDVKIYSMAKFMERGSDA